MKFSHCTCKSEAATGRAHAHYGLVWEEGEACPGNPSLAGDFDIYSFPWVACPAGGFLPDTIWEVGEGKGIIQKYISKISGKIKKNSKNSNNAISHNGPMLGSLQDHNNF